MFSKFVFYSTKHFKYKWGTLKPNKYQFLKIYTIIYFNYMLLIMIFDQIATISYPIRILNILYELWNIWGKIKENENNREYLFQL